MLDLSLHLTDIMQNSAEAGASLVEAEIAVEPEEKLLTLRVKDDGRGMSPEALEKVFDPFYTTRTTRRVGLGIPLLDDAARMAGGSVRIESAEGAGTAVTAAFRTDSIDRKPLGDIAEAAATFIAGYPESKFHMTLRCGASEFIFRTEDVRRQIGSVPINDIEIIAFIRDMLNEQITLLFGGILYEIIG